MNARLNFVGVCIGLMVISSAARAETPTGAELLRLVPSLSTQSDGLSSFQLKCRCLTHDDIPADVDVRWQNDGRYSLLLADASTHTPIACFSHNGFAVYNALERTITFGPEVTPEFRLFASDDSTIKIDFSWNQPDAKDPDPVFFKFDLPSFATPEALKVETNESGNRLEMLCPSPSGKSYAKWEFISEPEIAFKRFSIIWKADDTPLVRVDEVKTEKDVSTLSAPTSVVGDTTIRSIFWKPDGMPSFVELITDVFDAIGGHAALTNDKYRQLKSYRQTTDWTSVIDQCQIDRPFVIKLFSGASDRFE